jgi:hypothetical protein
VLRIRERAPTPYPFNVFTFRLVVESTKEFGGASTIFKKDFDQQNKEQNFVFTSGNE